MTDQTWRAHAACAGMDPNIFITVPGQSPDEAKAVCDGCPVAQRCLDFAVTTTFSGVWGGTTHKQRQRLRAGEPLSHRGPGRPPRQVSGSAWAPTYRDRGEEAS